LDEKETVKLGELASKLRCDFLEKAIHINENHGNDNQNILDMQENRNKKLYRNYTRKRQWLIDIDEGSS
jgi:hypothetical protein